MRREQLPRVVALHDHSVAERDRVVLSCASNVGNTTGGHHLQADQPERLLLGIREHAIRGLVHRAKRALGDEVVEEERVGAARRHGGCEVPRRRLGGQGHPLD